MPRRFVVDLTGAAPVWALPTAGAERIRAAAPADWLVTIVDAPTLSDGDGGGAPSAAAVAAIRDAEAYAGFGIGRELFNAAQALRWIHSGAAGVTGLLFPELVASEVTITNSAGVHAIPVAETVLGGVLYLLRSLDVASELQRAARWDKGPFVGARSPARELGECRVLVIGAGGIGSEIARRCTAFGARCTGIRRRASLGVIEGFERVVGPDALDAELPTADVLVLAAPNTGETRGLITAERLDLLPPNAIVVNIARGSLLDEDALAERVASGRLRGAVLDVFAEEPLPAASPLWALPNVVLTPHVSPVSPRRYWERELTLLLDNWERYQRGDTLRNVVDKHAGY